MTTTTTTTTPWSLAAGEFADYPAHALPAMPQGYMDCSWRNDVCPCMGHVDGHTFVYVDYPDATMREFQDGPRFTVNMTNSDGGMDCVMCTDDWSEVLALLPIL